jgi:hypothetical protein
MSRQTGESRACGDNMVLRAVCIEGWKVADQEIHGTILA